jgi:hypothetical protein
MLPQAAAFHSLALSIVFFSSSFVPLNSLSPYFVLVSRSLSHSLRELPRVADSCSYLASQIILLQILAPHICVTQSHSPFLLAEFPRSTKWEDFIIYSIKVVILYGFLRLSSQLHRTAMLPRSPPTKKKVRNISKKKNRV